MAKTSPEKSRIVPFLSLRRRTRQFGSTGGTRLYGATVKSGVGRFGNKEGDSHRSEAEPVSVPLGAEADAAVR